MDNNDKTSNIKTSSKMDDIKTNNTETNEKKYDFSYKPKKKVRDWLGPVGMCEICGRAPASVNLDLTAGTHRECRYCWDHV